MATVLIIKTYGLMDGLPVASILITKKLLNGFLVDSKEIDFDKLYFFTGSQVYALLYY